ncbi:MAG: EF-P lysine aminoacylase GenX [Planctomycetes bacterium]|nr:EF-P lysine aminoacylase GenX [Planctomycetota bacterium]
MSSADYLPSASWPIIQLRARLLQQVRQFFDTRGFVEVDTPVLSADTVVDRQLDPIEAEFRPDVRSAAGARRLFLQTSPEFDMKRILAAGATAIYQIGHAFRQGEFGARHNPEFTMLEWYRVGDDYAAGMELLADLVEVTLGRGRPERLTYAEAFARHAGIDPHHTPVNELIAAGAARGLTPPETFPRDERDLWLDWLLVELIEPKLGVGAPAILCDYPASQAALAVVRRGPPDVAERYELYADGIELANGYHELLDPAVLRERNRVNNQGRVHDGKAPLPEESRLLVAMERGLPQCSGVALGFDRLLMLVSGKQTLADVLPFPLDRA